MYGTFTDTAVLCARRVRAVARTAVRLEKVHLRRHAVRLIHSVGLASYEFTLVQSNPRATPKAQIESRRCTIIREAYTILPVPRQLQFARAAISARQERLPRPLICNNSELINW